MGDDSLAVGAAFAVGAIFVMVLGMYGGGGSRAIRRQIPQLAATAAVLVVSAVAFVAVPDSLGIALAFILIPASAVVLFLLVRQLQNRPRVTTAPRVADDRPTRFGVVVIMWSAILAVGTVIVVAALLGG